MAKNSAIVTVAATTKATLHLSNPKIGFFPYRGFDCLAKDVLCLLLPPGFA
jgi:hypothetical protein